MADPQGVIKLAAIADLHATKTSQGKWQPLFSQVAQSADIVLLCGDLTDYGSPEEAAIVLRDLTTAVKVPIVSVLGNHEFEVGKEQEIQKMFTDAGVRVLDGDTCEIYGVGFAGVKGFCGGFGERALEPWGEPAVKEFVRESLSEVLKLESALARLRTTQRVVLLHYSPIQATVEGEPPEIFPFLGSSRLEEPINRFPVTAVFHGHAHHGTLEGRTKGGVPVYNVAMPLLARKYPDRPPFRIVELPAAAAATKQS